MGRTLGVVIPHYNDSRFLAEAIAACVAGRRPADRVLVIDDGSSEHEYAAAADIVQSLRGHGRIEIERQPDNHGVVPTLNLGLERIGTDLVLFRAADDRTLPGYFHAIARHLEQHPEAGLGVGDIRYYTDSPDEGVVESLGLAREGLFSPDELARHLSATRILHSAVVVFDRGKLADAGGFAPDTDLYHDWWACHQIAFRHGIVYWPHAGTAFKLRADSVSSRCYRDVIRARRSIEAIEQRLRCESDAVRSRFERAHLLSFFDFVCGSAGSHGANGVSDLQPSAGGIQSVLRVRLEKVAPAVRSVRGRVFVFGAGTHSKVLLHEWNQLNLPSITAILVTKPDATTFGTLPLLAASEARLNAEDLVVLSSKSFEEAMAETARRLHPHARVLSFWNPAHTTI